MILWLQFSPWFFGGERGKLTSSFDSHKIPVIISKFRWLFFLPRISHRLIQHFLWSSQYFFSNLAFLPVRGHYRSDQRFTRQPAMSSKSIPPLSGCGFPRSWCVWWDGSVQEIWLLLWQHLLRESKPFLVAHGNQDLNTQQLTQMFHSVNAPKLQGWDSAGQL